MQLYPYYNYMINILSKHSDLDSILLNYFICPLNLKSNNLYYFLSLIQKRKVGGKKEQKDKRQRRGIK